MNTRANFTRILLALLFLLVHAVAANSQRARADSFLRLLQVEKSDTGKVNYMWKSARDLTISKPDTALLLAQQALYLSRNINYTEGESRSLGILANCFMVTGNYSKALALDFEKLQLEEKRNNPRGLSSVLMNIGIVYVYMEEYRKALEYYEKSDSVIDKHHIDELKYNILLNLGDVYNKLDKSDSAYVHFNKSLEIAQQSGDNNSIGLALTGLGHSYRKLGSNEQAQKSYEDAIRYLAMANNDEVFCEAALGLATLYESMGRNDSATRYAMQSLNTAKKAGFLNPQLDASEFLNKHYSRLHNIDSAFVYLNFKQQLNDSVNSTSKIREAQIISSNEQFRQLELEESKKEEAKQRYQQLQMLLIAIFIPGLFLITLLLSRAKIHIKVIRLLGVLSLLFFFEYLTLLLHPTVAHLTGHTPIYEILVFVVIAAVLIPTHHKMEHWLIHKLIHHRIHHHAPTAEVKEEASQEKATSSK